MDDEKRRSFLDSLDKADITVSDREARFLDWTIDREVFTPRQRKAIDRMIEKYGEFFEWQ